MSSALLGMLSPIVAAILHAASVRWLPDRLRLTSIPIFNLVVLLILGSVLTNAGSVVTVEDWLVALVLTLSAGFAYALLFLAIMFDSPTLAIVNAIEDHGPEGMPIDAFPSFASSHPFVRSRLDALIVSGIVDDTDAILVFRGKVGLLLRFTDAYRRLCGFQSKTG